jgi:hypothetical protein
MILILLISSVLLNVFFIWYLRNVLRDYFYVLEHIEDLLDDLAGFANHLEGVHALETFYGDSTLQSLIKHSKEFTERVRGYERALAVTEEEEDGQEEED